MTRATPPLPRPDALAVCPVASHAVLAPADALALFGAPLRGTERVRVVRHGRDVALVPVAAGSAARLVLDTLFGAPLDGLRLVGPVGAMPAPAPERVTSRLVLPAGLSRAWGVDVTAVVGIGLIALKVPVEAGTDAGLDVDRALWLAAGRPESARWLAQTTWPDADAMALPDADAPGDAAGALVVPRRVVTETDVRQARLHRRTIRITPGQIVTPAAATMAREWGVFAAS